jgi:hypothetical protein
MWEANAIGSQNSPTKCSREPIEWLIPTYLLRFPIVSDVLQWLGCKANSNDNLQQLMFSGKTVCVLLCDENDELNPNCFKEYINLAILYGYNISVIYTLGEETTIQGLQITGPLKTLLWKSSLPLNLVMKQMPDPDDKMVTVITEPVKIVQISTAETTVVDYYLNKIVENVKLLGRPRAY